jgi:hypothetical protein
MHSYHPSRLRQYAIIKCALWLPALLAIFNSCTFNPDGDALTEIEIPNPTNTVIDFFESQDTLLVRGPFSFSLSVTTPEIITAYKILVDDRVIKDEIGAPFSIDFDSKNYADGIHTVTIEVTKLHKSESMASKMGVEVYKQTYSRKIETFNKPIIAPAITSTIEAGVLVLHWEPYVGHGFKYYEIKCAELQMQETIDLQHQGSLPIPYFFGGSAKFVLSLKAFYEQDTSSLDYQTFYAAKIERTEGGLNYQWTESPFNNCAGFKVTMDANGQQQEILFENETKIVDLQASYAFPYDVAGTLHVFSNDGREILLKAKSYSTREKIGGSNPDYHRFKQFIPHPTNDSLMLIYYLDDAAETYNSRGRLALYNRATGAEIKMLTGFFGISPNGQHIYYYNIYNKIVPLDPANLSEGSGILFKDIVPTGHLWQFHVSDDNKLLLSASQVTSGVNMYFVYDWNTKTLDFSSVVTLSSNRSGWLGNGGKQFYNKSSREVLSIDKSPQEYFYLNTKEVPLVHINRSVSPVGVTALAVNALLPRSVLYQINYANDIKRVFANQQNEIGVVYVHDGKVKIDFFDHRDLTLLSTVETQLLTSRVTSYVFSLVEDELFVYLYYNYDQGSVHHLKIDF